MFALAFQVLGVVMALNLIIGAIALTFRAVGWLCTPSRILKGETEEQRKQRAANLAKVYRGRPRLISFSFRTNPPSLRDGKAPKP